MKLLRWILLPPLAIIVIALAIANRHSVTFSLDPFDAQNPAISFDLPLAAMLALGVVACTLWKLKQLLPFGMCARAPIKNEPQTKFLSI